MKASKTDRRMKRLGANSSYQSFRKKFEKPANSGSSSSFDKSKYNSNPIYKRAAGGYSSYPEWRTERAQFYDRRSWDTPNYVYNSSPSFGMWDAMFLWWMLDSINQPSHAEWVHNHRNDPGFQQWRAEAQRLASDNAELESKLNAMEVKLEGKSGRSVVYAE